MCIFIIPLLAHEHAVVEHDFTLGATRHESVMGDHDDRGALVMQLAEQVEDDLLVLLVQVAGGLIGENQLRVVDQRTRDAHALLLAAGQLARQMVSAVLQTDLLQRLKGLLLVDDRMVVLRDHHVLDGRQVRHQIELLEHQADQVLAHVGELAGVQILQLAALQRNGALARRVHAADHVHQRRLAGTRRADDGQPFALRNGQAQIIDRMQVAVDLGNMIEFKQHIHDYSLTIPTIPRAARPRGRCAWRDAPGGWMRRRRPAR